MINKTRNTTSVTDRNRGKNGSDRRKDHRREEEEEATLLYSLSTSTKPRPVLHLATGKEVTVVSSPITMDNYRDARTGVIRVKLHVFCPGTKLVEQKWKQQHLQKEQQQQRQQEKKYEKEQKEEQKEKGTSSRAAGSGIGFTDSYQKSYKDNNTGLVRPKTRPITTGTREERRGRRGRRRERKNEEEKQTVASFSIDDFKF